MAKEARTYTVIYERDEDGWWVASVRGVRGCRTQGRSIAEARRRIREALSLFVEEVTNAGFVDDVRLPRAALRALKNARDAKGRARSETAKATAAAALAVRVLTKQLRLSVRDVADLVGLSHQRVHQLVHARSSEGSAA
jgi:predicted RNase H-like HicB family nuclease